MAFVHLKSAVYDLSFLHLITQLSSPSYGPVHNWRRQILPSITILDPQFQEIDTFWNRFW